MEDLYNQVFDKYQKAVGINPDSHEAFYNWGNDLGKLAGTKEGKEAEDLFSQASEKFQKAIDIKPDKENALIYLNRSFKKEEVKVDFVRKDEDWKSYLEDENFIMLLKKYE